MPTVPSQNVNIGSSARMPGGSISSPQLPRNSSLLNARLSNTVNQNPNANAQSGFSGVRQYENDRRLSGALDKAAGAFQIVAEKLQNDLDEAAIKEADNKLSDVIRSSLMDPDAGYLGTMGRSSIEARSPTLNNITKARDEIMKSLPSDRQKAGFQMSSGQRISTATDTMDKHAFQQVQVYKKAESKARIEAARTDAAANWGSWKEKDADGKKMGAYNLHKDVMLGEVEKQVQANGFQPGSKGYRDEVLNQMLTQTTSLHKEVIENMVSFGQTSEAKQYFDEAIKRGEVHPDSLDVVNDLINTGAVKNDSLLLSFGLEGSFQEKKKQLKQMFTGDEINAEVYDATMARIKAQDEEFEARKSEYQKDVMTQAENWMVNNPGNTWVDLPANIQQGLKATGQIDKIVSFSNNGGYKQSTDVWMEFLSLPASELEVMTPTTFYNKYRDKFDNAHMEKGAAMVGSRNSKDRNQNKIITVTERLKRSAQENGFFPYDGKASESEQVKFNRFEEAVQNRFNEFGESNDRDPRPDEMQKIIDTVLLDTVMVSEWGRDSEVSVHLMDPEKLSSTYVEVGDQEVRMSEIPPDHMALITDALVQSGQTVTMKKIAAAWMRRNNGK